MDELQILSLELERTPKSMGVEFTNLQTVPYLSVCTTSTHDRDPLRNWWQENPPRTQHYYQSVLGRIGESPAHCTSELAEQIIMNHLYASSKLTVIPLQDWFALDDTLKQEDIESERINMPENPRHYWRYRMHISLEQLLQPNELNRKIREMIEKSGR
jgi:4-alpha-glucanotransferase